MVDEQLNKSGTEQTTNKGVASDKNDLKKTRQEENLYPSDFEEDYISGVDKEKIKENNPGASWGKIMDEVLNQKTPEAAMDALLIGLLTQPLAWAAYRSELYLAEEKGRIEHVDKRANAWNKTIRKLKGLSESDVLQAIQGDFLHDPSGLIARYNKDVYDGLITDDNGRYRGDQAALLDKRIEEKEAQLKQTNPELFAGLQKDKDGRYSPKEAEIFRTRFLMHMHPDLLTGIGKGENGTYSEKDVALFKERLLTKNFKTVYEREPTIRERQGMVGGFKNKEQMNLHIKAQKGIYGLSLGMIELAAQERQIPDSITHDMHQAWTNLRNGKDLFGSLLPGLEKAYVNVPTAKEKYQEWHAKLQAKSEQKEAPVHGERKEEPKTVTPPAPEFHNEVPKEMASPDVAPMPERVAGKTDTTKRTPTTIDKAHGNLNASGTVETMKAAKAGLDQAISGIQSKEQQLSVEDQLLSRLHQNVAQRAPGNSLGRTNDQRSM